MRIVVFAAAVRRMGADASAEVAFVADRYGFSWTWQPAYSVRERALPHEDMLVSSAMPWGPEQRAACKELDLASVPFFTDDAVVPSQDQRAAKGGDRE